VLTDDKGKPLTDPAKGAKIQIVLAKKEISATIDAVKERDVQGN
jgi:hypothetical protein